MVDSDIPMITEQPHKDPKLVFRTESGGNNSQTNDSLLTDDVQSKTLTNQATKSFSQPSSPSRLPRSSHTRLSNPKVDNFDSKSACVDFDDSL